MNEGLKNIFVMKKRFNYIFDEKKLIKIITHEYIIFLTNNYFNIKYKFLLDYFDKYRILRTRILTKIR